MTLGDPVEQLQYVHFSNRGCYGIVVKITNR